MNARIRSYNALAVAYPGEIVIFPEGSFAIAASDRSRRRAAIRRFESIPWQRKQLLERIGRTSWLKSTGRGAFGADAGAGGRGAAAAAMASASGATTASAVASGRGRLGRRGKRVKEADRMRRFRVRRRRSELGRYISSYDNSPRREFRRAPGVMGRIEEFDVPRRR